MSKERRINWLGLFIKLIIVFVLVIILVWLITKILYSNKLSDTFKNNINNMEKASIDYFKTIDLPLEKGKSAKITLKELIDKGLILSKNDEDENSCNVNDSYSKIVRKKDNYNVETTLKCGDEKSTIYRKFSLKDCKNCNKTTKKDKSVKEDKANTSKRNNNKKDNDDSTVKMGDKNKITYYEYVKENVSYSKWMKGNLTGNNIENKYEYYSIEDKTYYSFAYVKTSEIKNKKDISYTFKLVNVPNNKYYFTSINSSNYFNNNDIDSYLNEKDIKLSKNNISISKESLKSSLADNNFAYKLYPYYRKGNFYIDVKLTIKSTDNVKSYYSSELKENIFLIPLKLDIRFASNNITSNKPDGKYETISYYRYVEKSKDVIWSSESNVDGYTKTGNEKVE